MAISTPTQAQDFGHVGTWEIKLIRGVQFVGSEAEKQNANFYKTRPEMTNSGKSLCNVYLSLAWFVDDSSL
ncbi:predicted protein [Sclerotinia sclerotiorum 1980 UF-70]|uniref:Uncharacterized protein n=1 Tax=Sclerotinia sclerotiorum (strain ATCC 18683 / 1980 / Ss-1) TaxID=665079 RepID=A7EX90_SCLS1|nr:predicted protein [Sclerotinia sclerotiorum 1980 UF-70]EDN94082.1 predicted protein [Sclerotinia sclerotiorum 1980 UF-70]